MAYLFFFPPHGIGKKKKKPYWRSFLWNGNRTEGRSLVLDFDRRIMTLLSFL